MLQVLHHRLRRGRRARDLPPQVQRHAVVGRLLQLAPEREHALHEIPLAVHGRPPEPEVLRLQVRDEPLVAVYERLRFGMVREPQRGQLLLQALHRRLVLALARGRLGGGGIAPQPDLLVLRRRRTCVLVIA